MEHRWHKRNDINVAVTLYHHGAPVGSCEAQNFSDSGIYIQPTEREIPINAPVEVEFTLNSRRKTSRVKIPARVIHRRSGGVGLMFQPKTITTGKVLHELLGHA